MLMSNNLRCQEDTPDENKILQEGMTKQLKNCIDLSFLFGPLQEGQEGKIALTEKKWPKR